MLDLILALGFLLGAADELPSFPEVWYSEVMLGNVAQAAEAYQKIHLSPPSEDLLPETRQKAAFRAGVCFEKLNQIELARAAYTSVPAAGPHSGALADEAVLRLKSLGEDGSRDVRSPSAEGVTVEVAVQKLVESGAAAERQRGDALIAIAAETSDRRREAFARGQLIERLARRGLAVSFAREAAAAAGASEPQGPPPPIEVLKAWVREADMARLQPRLAGAALERSLRSLGAGDRAAARDELRAAHHLGAAGGVFAWARSLLDEEVPSSIAAGLARRRLFEEDLLRRASLRRELRALVENAGRLAKERGRPDLAVLDLEKAREAADWAPAAWRGDVEVKSLDAERAKLFFLLLPGGGREREFARLWAAAREQTDRLAAAADELARLMAAEGRFRGPAAPGAAGGGPEAGLDAARAEAERLLAAAAEVPAKDPHAAERAAREALQLVEWFPALENGINYQRRARAILAALHGQEVTPASDAR